MEIIMKKYLSAFTFLISFMTIPVFANTCIDEIKNHDELGSLTMSDCQLKDNDIPAIVSYLQSHKKIKRLYLEDNQIGPAGASALTGLPYTIRTINISNNPIGDTGSIYLANNTSLKTLWMYSANIGPSGATALAKNNSLEELVLEDNHIGDEGMKALVKNTSLKRLFVNKNYIGNDGLSAMKDNNTLEALYVGDEHFDSVAIQNL